MELEGFAAVMETVRNRAAGLRDRAIAGPHDYAQIPALVDRGMERIRDFYSDLEARLGEQPFVAGAAFSAADITAVVTIDFATTSARHPRSKGGVLALVRCPGGSEEFLGLTAALSIRSRVSHVRFRTWDSRSDRESGSMPIYVLGKPPALLHLSQPGGQ